MWNTIGHSWYRLVTIRRMVPPTQRRHTAGTDTESLFQTNGPETLIGMGSATYNHRKGTTFAATQRRSAERRRCPQCGRKAALVKTEDGDRECRWCGWASWMDWKENSQT